MIGSRPAELCRELRAVVDVRGRQAAYRGLLSDGDLDGSSVPDRESLWSTVISEPGEGSGTLVLTESDRVVGFSHFGRSRDDDAAATTSDLRCICLDPDRCGSGGGSLLLAQAEYAASHFVSGVKHLPVSYSFR